MRQLRIASCAAGAAVLVLVSSAVGQTGDLTRVLFLTHSAGYRHEVVTREDPSMPSLAESQLVARSSRVFDVVATQDPSVLTPESLTKFDVVVFYTTGELPIAGDARRALFDFVAGGGGFVGVHCAADTFYDVPEYRKMLGGVFDGHPWHQSVRVKVEDPAHPSAAHLGESFEITDEIYQFRDWDRANVHVVLSLDPDSVDLALPGVNRQDRDFALAWTREVGRGRVFYTALGHRPEVWRDDRFLTHLLEGIRWAAGALVPGPDGFVPLLDAEHAGGWEQAGPGGFTVAEGVATPEGGMGLWYFRRAFRNFILKLEFRQNAISANSGVFVRFPRVDGDPWIPVREGYEIQIAGDSPAPNQTGAIYSFQAPTAVPLEPAGEWNEYEISCLGARTFVRLNGALINEYTGDRNSFGMIGVQNHGGQSIVQYRNIRILELPESATAYHVLFAGDASGWRMAGPGSFETVDGALSSRGGMGLLWHESAAFRDFTLFYEWRVGRREDNSGVFVRFPDPADDPWIAVREGYEIQICDTGDAAHRTGSIYDFADSDSIPTRPPGDWNHGRIEVAGQRYRVWVNGVLVNEFRGERSLEGHVGLQNHDERSRVEFREIRVVE